jgi:hypothetical protein
MSRSGDSFSLSISSIVLTSSPLASASRSRSQRRRTRSCTRRAPKNVDQSGLDQLVDSLGPLSIRGKVGQQLRVQPFEQQLPGLEVPFTRGSNDVSVHERQSTQDDSRPVAVTCWRVTTRSPSTDRFVLPDSWEALARKVRIRGGLHQRDPANYPRIKIGRFDAQVRIGEGGFGMVFKVFDPEFERWVALKLCLARSPSATEGLMEEARTLAELNHPNIVTVYEPGE